MNSSSSHISKEQCQFIIKNNAQLEGGLIQSMETQVFKAINTRLETRLRTITGWKGHFEFYTGPSDETHFAPAAWPESADGRYPI